MSAVRRFSVLVFESGDSTIAWTSCLRKICHRSTVDVATCSTVSDCDFYLHPLGTCGEQVSAFVQCVLRQSNAVHSRSSLVEIVRKTSILPGMRAKHRTFTDFHISHASPTILGKWAKPGPRYFSFRCTWGKTSSPQGAESLYLEINILFRSSSIAVLL